MHFYKFHILLLSFLILSCSATEEASTETADTTSSTTSITLESQDNLEDDDFDYDIALENFENYWETLLKEDNPLTFEELALTYNLNELMNKDLNWDEGTGAYFYVQERRGKTNVFLCPQNESKNYRNNDLLLITSSYNKFYYFLDPIHFPDHIQAVKI